jgi:hypothetical protein
MHERDRYLSRHLGWFFGVQIIGPYLGDYTTTWLAEVAEQELGGFHLPECRKTGAKNLFLSIGRLDG